MSRAKKAIGAIVAASAALGGIAAGSLALRISRALDASRQEVRQQGEFEFTLRPYVPEAAPPFDAISAPADFTRAERFQDNLYIAGPAGLLQYAPDGRLERQFVAGRDLPASPLVDMARTVLANSQQEELILATATDGLLAFNGGSFRQIYPRDRESREITSVLATPSGHLLLGTKKRGVLLFDGRRISVLHPMLAKTYVTALAGDETDLWVGTLDRGLLHWHAGETEAFAEHEGLLDPQVLSLALAGDKTFVGTPLGVAAFERGKFSRVLAPGVFATALLATPERLMIGTEDQGVIALPFGPGPRAVPFGIAAPSTEVKQLLAWGDGVYVLTRAEIYRMNARGLARQEVLRKSDATLTDRNVSALAVDANGRLWIGYFNRGLDLLDVPGGRVMHVEDEHVFCVNRILPETRTGTVNVATANGLVRFGPGGTEEQVLTRSAGLIANHVTDVAAYGEGLALATPAGLTFLDRNGVRSLYAFQGLVNNHVYALGVAGDQLLAGTLGGISVIGREAVQANYTMGNSGLQHNWITAVAPVNDEWLVGTYGAGILALDRQGHFRGLGEATGPFNVSPNALLVTADHVFAGALDHGLLVQDRATGRWSAVTKGLPSSSVTALAAGGGYVYVGTDNGLVRIEERKLQP
jgi:ligand-binding sensor domain-containing protein